MLGILGPNASTMVCLVFFKAFLSVSAQWELEYEITREKAQCIRSIYTPKSAIDTVAIRKLNSLAAGEENKG